ncbi:hypothetical protein SYNPS1DRAFT_30326 [Syncephalis pseudoplumigaleata]|uniref:Uncharacterized protein n=1 Tax=Syncephalis pseudoplumigaleata TaxID=1712513 RepID=A0A4P9YWP2_9FUNG|nr:hypothetical protein SYNPS1DRAFT_30326 [Syncephalis pseudoplumigaleata]|eukprot:RKP23912.1 hypothetical protein SYNPS1DRAFT_30326 [Syncephalis pseudoplumigaleata]
MLGARIIFTAIVVALALPLVTSNVAQVVSPHRYGPETVPGLAKQANFNGKNGWKYHGIDVIFHCIEKSSMSTPLNKQAANDAAFYESCLDHQKKEQKREPAMDYIGCPFARYQEPLKICYIIKAPIGMVRLTVPDTFHYMKSRGPTFRDTVMNNIVAGHKLADDLGWLLGWNFNNVAFEPRGEVLIASLGDRMSKAEAAKSGGRRNAGRENSLESFLKLFFASFSFPGDNAKQLRKNVMEQLQFPPSANRRSSF